MAAQTRLDNAILAVSGSLNERRKMSIVCDVKVGSESVLIVHKINLRYEQLLQIFMKFDATTLDCLCLGRCYRLYAAYSNL